RANIANDELAAPIQKAGADQPIGIDGIAVENIRAGVGLADVLLVDALADLYAGVLLDIEFRPARREILDKDTVTVITEGVKELLALCFCYEFGRNLDDDFAIASVGIDPFDVVYEFLEVELESCKAQVRLFIHSVDGNIDLVDPGLEHRPNALR